MRFTFSSKNCQVSDAMRERATTKIERLSKLFPPDAEVFVKFKVEKMICSVEVSIPLKQRVLRALTSAQSDFVPAIDAVVDSIDRQMVKYKQRLQNKSKKENKFKDELAGLVPTTPDYEADKSEIIIEKTKHFALKPMDAEEAVMEMELLGHNFFVFKSANEERVNVVYRRSDGTYGLIEPEN